MSSNSAMDGLKEAHERNEAQLQMLEKEVQRATSPPVMTSEPAEDENSRSANARSPTSLASALFHRKPKSKSKSKSKSSGGATPPVAPVRGASPAELHSLHQKVEQARDNEMGVISSAIGISNDGTELNANGQDDVLDLADQLLAQLDAKERGSDMSGSAIPASGYATTQGTPLVAPQPIPGAAAAAPTFTSSGQSSSLHHVSSTSSVSSSSASTGVSRKSSNPFSTSSSSSPKHGFGAKLKEAFSPPSSSNHDSSAVGAAGVHKNRHALRKERKQAADDRLRAEAQAEVEAGRANGQVDHAEVEKRGMDRLLRQYNLEIVEMDPDGHCMYSSIADQLNARKILRKSDYKVTRKVAADYMRKHMDEFLPYLPAEDEQGQGEGLLSPEGYLKHCDNVESTGEWGSETEILALSQHFQIPIYVFQAGSPLVKVGEDATYAKKEPLTISYHRHQFGSGEHYNSLRPIPRDTGLLSMGGM